MCKQTIIPVIAAYPRSAVPEEGKAKLPRGEYNSNSDVPKFVIIIAFIIELLLWHASF